MKSTSKSKALMANGLLLVLAGWLLLASSVDAQTAAPGWTLNVHATDVSTLSGGEALSADLATGDLFVKSLQDPSGLNVQLAQVTPSGTVTILATFSSVQNSDISGIAIDPLTGGIIVADEIGGLVFGRIALIDLSTAPPTISTLFPLNWDMNPNSNGTGQQQYAPDPGNPNILYFWDSTLSKLFRLDRSTNTLVEILALDQGTPVGSHLSTFANDILFDAATGTLLVTDNLSSSILEVDPSTSPPTVTTLFSGVTGPVSIALNPLTNQVFVALGFNSISVGPRTGGSLSPVASGFSFLTDIVVGNATAGTGLSLFVVDKTLDTVYEIETPSQAIQSLIAAVQGLPLNPGQQNSLIAKLQAALNALANGNITAACGQLNAFINQVNGFVQAGQLFAATGASLVAQAQAIRTALGC